MKNFTSLWTHHLKKYFRQTSYHLSVFVLLVPTLLSSLQAVESDENLYDHPTGAIPLTEEQMEHIKNNWPRILGVRPNKYGAARIQAYMDEKGFALMGVQAVEDDQEEFITNKNTASNLMAGDQEELATALPPAVDNSKLACFPPIGDQQHLGSCVGWASTYYHATHEYGLLNGINNKTSSQGIRSPKWTYNMLNAGQDSGAVPARAYELLSTNGAVALNEFPYDTNYREWDLNTQHWISALSYRMNPTMVLYIDDSSDVNTLKQLLNNGHIVTFMTYAGSWQYTKVLKDPTQATTPYVGQRAISWMKGTSGGHHATIVGYDDNVWIDVNGNGKVDPGEKGAFLMANSWGTDWANQGFVWISYDAFYKTSQVASGPNTGRNQIAPILFSITPKSSKYIPKAVAKFSLSQSIRNQLKLSLGASSTTAATPSKKFVPAALTQDGGAFAFDGLSPHLQTATFVLDLTDLLPTTNISQKYYLIVEDTTSGNPTSLTAYSIMDLVNNKEVLYKGTPLSSDKSISQPNIVFQPSQGNADTTPPQITITYPTNLATINGSIFATVNVSDNVKVSRVEFYVDSDLLNTDTTAPFVLSLDTTKLSNGQHVLTAIAYDDAGNNARQSVTVNVQNSSDEDTHFPSYLSYQQNKVSGWGNGAQFDCTLKNQGTKSVSDFKIKIAVPPANIDLWNVSIIASDSQSVTISLPSWKESLAPGETLSFGFVVQPEMTPEVTFISASQE